MANTISSTSTAGSSATPNYAIVRHYNVLFSADKDKRETNRVWHDGRLAHHTYNGKVFLYDEADIQLREQFFTNGSPIMPGGPANLPLFADESELTIREFLVQIQSFQRVSRTDITPLLQTKELAKARKMAALQSPQRPVAGPSRAAIVAGSPRTPAHGSSSNGTFSTSATSARQVGGSSASGLQQASTILTGSDTTPLRPISNFGSSGSHRASSICHPSFRTPAAAASASALVNVRRGPASPHPFKTPFKSPSLKRKAVDDRDKRVVKASPSSSNIERRAMSAAGKVEANIEVARKERPGIHSDTGVVK